MGFLSDLAVIAVKSTIGYMQSIPEVKEAAAVLHVAEEQDGWISSEEFFDAYDVRIYDPQNDQHDIKIMKEHDFEGGYVLWNKSKNLYHTGVGTCVYKKVERHFRGYGNEAVFFDCEEGDSFAVSLYIDCLIPNTTICRPWKRLSEKRTVSTLFMSSSKRSPRPLRHLATEGSSDSSVASLADGSCMCCRQLPLQHRIYRRP